MLACYIVKILNQMSFDLLNFQTHRYTGHFEMYSANLTYSDNAIMPKKKRSNWVYVSIKLYFLFISFLVLFTHMHFT